MGHTIAVHPAVRRGRATEETTPRRGSARATRHALAAGAVAGYLIAAGGSLAAYAVLPMPRWLALHLLLLGAVTNAIAVWSEHFTVALLHAPEPGVRGFVLRLVGLNVGVLAVLTGVAAGRWPALVWAGAVAVVVVVLSQGAVFAWRIRGAVGARLGFVVWFYVAATVAVAVGAGLGAALATGLLVPAGGDAGYHLAHVHLNLLGWVGLTVVGTELTLWPTVLRTRMVDGVLPAAKRVLALCGAGVAVAAAGFLADVRALAAAGLALYAAGLLVALDPFVRTLQRRRPHTAASWMLGASMLWFVAVVLADLAAVALPGLLAAAEPAIDRLVPVLVAGFVCQVLVGALTFLLPVVLGCGPAGNAELGALLERGWRLRLAALNGGVLLLALPDVGPVRLAGVGLVVAALGSFAALVVAALGRQLSAAQPAGRPAKPR